MSLLQFGVDSKEYAAAGLEEALELAYRSESLKSHTTCPESWEPKNTSLTIFLERPFSSVAPPSTLRPLIGEIDTPKLRCYHFLSDLHWRIFGLFVTQEL